MHGASRRGLWLASRSSARFVAGRRIPPRPSSRRSFHATTPISSKATSPWPWSSSSSSSSSPSTDTSNDKTSLNEDEDRQDPKSSSHEESSAATSTDVHPAPEAAHFDILDNLPQLIRVELPHETSHGSDQPPEANGAGGDKERASSRTANLKRFARNRRQKDIPPIRIPAWFLERNVKLARYNKHPLLDLPLEVVPNGEMSKKLAPEASSPSSSSQQRNDLSDGEIAPKETEDKIADLATSLGECIAIMERMRDLEPEKLDQAGQSPLFEEAASALSVLSERLRIARAEGNMEELLSAVQDKFPDFQQEFEAFKNSEKIGRQQAAKFTPYTSASSSSSSNSTALPHYRLHTTQMYEICTSIAASLSLPEKLPRVSDTYPISRAHVKLLCPVDGGMYFLDKLVEQAASELGADLIKLDAQDIAELAGDYIQEGPQAASSAIWALGYEAGLAYNRDLEADEEGENEFEDGNDEEIEHDSNPRARFATATAVPIMSISGANIRDSFKKLLQDPSLDHLIQNGKPMGRSEGLGSPGSSTIPSRQWNEMKLSALLDALLDANQVKNGRECLTVQYLIGKIQEKLQAQGAGPNRFPLPHQSYDSSLPSTSGAISPVDASEVPKTVVLVSGFNDIVNTTAGARIIDKLLDALQKRRNSGQAIMLIGTSASSDIATKLTGQTLAALQSDDPDSPCRSIIVTPEAAGPSGGLFFQAQKQKIREINLRHLYSMIVRMQPSATGVEWEQTLQEFSAELEAKLENTDFPGYLEEEVLPLLDIHRVVSTAIGHANIPPQDEDQLKSMSAEHIVSAMRVVTESDNAKITWAEEEQKLQQPLAETEKKPVDTRLNKLRKTCNTHEKALLKGVVNPENIKTTFGDVHAPPETIEALKTLTTLSLTRPDAFRYGVLAKDKISGLLLYGPPGTGKTLLARAVAKESGATVLEVSGSDVYDMYVGEGEKNVRAVFSLAKKLAPCVVFIDEADAIFASRGAGINRNSHRELINQFLREWDGMTETTAFIMVATNRPFDLDDAALRRLPRRLLVDLPSEKDRETILEIHLKDESIDSSVSLANLAGQTALYSGSDLKNLAVAAALAAVREENEAAAQHTGEQPYELPARRILTQAHFDKAMEEISASVSEDMSSLGAIRKFDEKYGDRRGRKKKLGYGFSGGQQQGQKEETAKVRT